MECISRLADEDLDFLPKHLARRIGLMAPASSPADGLLDRKDFHGGNVGMWGGRETAKLAEWVGKGTEAAWKVGRCR